MQYAKWIKYINMDANEARKFYGNIRGKFGDDYEYRRWFSSPLAQAGYAMTLRSITRHCFEKDWSFTKYLELGPGAGTWTRLFIEKNPKAHFDLVDISHEMLSFAKEKLEKYEQVTYYESDFIQFISKDHYDIFFSSRAIEYIPDKDAAVAKIAELLRSGGRGFISTKAPKYIRSKLIGRGISSLHQGQISPRDLVALLKSHHFTDIACYPVTMYVPALHSPRLNTLLHSLCFWMKLNWFTELFSESYCVTFRKS